MRIENATSQRTTAHPKSLYQKLTCCFASGLQKVYTKLNPDFFWGDPFAKSGYQKWKSGREFFVVRLLEAETDKGLVGFLLERKTNEIVVCDLIDGRDGLIALNHNDRPDLRAKYFVQDLAGYFRKE